MRSSNSNKEKRIRKQLDSVSGPSLELLRSEAARIERFGAYRRLALVMVSIIFVLASSVNIATNIWFPILQIEGSSMSPTLEAEQIVLAVKGDSPAKNDIIAFYHNNKLHVKRVIATAGDRLEIDEKGTVSVHGTAIDEPYVAELSRGSCDIEFPFIVPAGTVFVMGDNRPHSFDSRDSRFGPIPSEQIIGKIKCRIWPLFRAENT